MAGTSMERLRYLTRINHRLQKFLSAAGRHGWRIEVSEHVEDCITVRHPRLDDHFVLYPRGSGRTSSVQVYDGRDSYEWAPIPARTARAYMAQNHL